MHIFLLKKIGSRSECYAAQTVHEKALAESADEGTGNKGIACE